MAQFGSETNPAGENTAVLEPPSPEQLMAQMAALVKKVAAMQVEIDMQKLQMRGIGKAKDRGQPGIHPTSNRRPEALRLRSRRSRRRKSRRNSSVILLDAAARPGRSSSDLVDTAGLG